MTTMTKAISDAGIIKVTTSKKIWQWLKDNGPHTCVEVGIALDVKPSASTLLSQMAARKMVAGVKKYSEHSRREVTYYSAIGRVYVALPLPKKEKKTIPQSTEVVVLDQILPKKSKVEEMLDTLSVVDAFDLYKRLDLMFNPVKS